MTHNESPQPAGPDRHRLARPSLPAADAGPPVLRVFVSSTWLDLQPERAAVEQALARLRETKFIGMEHFGSRDESTRDVSLLEVNPADLYVGIIGGRYGSGITEDEYRRAQELKLPCFIYFKDDAAIEPDGRDQDPDRAHRLVRLKEDMRRHCATTFRGPDDLAARLTADLHRWVFDCYLHGLSALRTDYKTRIEGFLAEYLGSPKKPVPFGGRDADLARLDAWLEDPSAEPYLLLAAPAGRGKSALLVRWTQRLLTNSNLAICFVPASIRFRTNLAGVFFPAVTARLAALHGDTLKAEPNTSVEVWRGMMTEYLKTPLPDGRRLLVLLDGLDEAADWAAGPDLLPVSPPPGLRVLLSARLRAGDADAHSWLSTLGWEGSGLGKTLDLDRLTVAGVADVLAEMGCPLDVLGRREEIVDELHRLSEGDPLLVRLYVDDLWKQGAAAARLRPEDLRKLRPGLVGYFERWWKEQHELWGEQAPLREPSVQGLLNLLACALGPLSREDMLQLAPPELELNTWMLEEALRPLARFVIGDGVQQGYVFSHPRLAGYFRDERLTARERQKVEARFLSYGEETLAGLNDGRLSPVDAPPYVVQYYAAHIERAGQGPARLLALVSDGWRRAWELRDGSCAGFLIDVDRAWRAADKVDEAEIARGRTATWPGGQARCALCRASIHNLAMNVPPELLEAAVRQGVWTPVQVLASARQVGDERELVERLSRLVPYLPEPLRNEALGQALEAIGSFRDEGPRSSALAALAPHLPAAILGRTLESVGDFRDGDARASVLAALAPHLPAALLGEALEAARAISREEYRSRALVSLAPHLPPALLAKAVEAVAGIRDEGARSHALSALAPHLPAVHREKVLGQALKSAGAIEDAHDRSRRLAALAVHLPPAHREEVLGQALKSARTIRDAVLHASALAALAPHLPAAQRETVLGEALVAARKNQDEGARASALTALAPHLSAALRGQALEIARAIREEGARTRALAALAPHLPAALREEVLEQGLGTARAIRDVFHRARALATLAPHLPPALLGQALVAVRAIQDAFHLSRALAALAPHLPPARRQEVLEQALDAARATQRGVAGSRALARLVPHLPPAQQQEVLEQALGPVRAIPDEGARTSALAALASDLPPALGDEIRRQALGVARAIPDAFQRSRALAALVPHLPAALREKVLEQAIEAARAIPDEGACSSALILLAPHLPAAVREEVLGPALGAARNLQDAFHRARALAALAPHLPPAAREEVLEQTLGAVRAIPDAFHRSGGLAALAPHLSAALGEEVLGQALAAAQGIRDEGVRSFALAALAPHLPAALREEVLGQALQSAQASRDAGTCSSVLADLAPHLPAALLGRGLEVAGAIWDEGARSQALAALAPSLPPPLLAQALEIAQALQDADTRSHALAALAPPLATHPASFLFPLWRQTLPVLAGRTRSDFLSDLCHLLPILLRLGGPQAVAETFTAIQDVGRWWP